jgi:hypothetical protein
MRIANHLSEPRATSRWLDAERLPVVAIVLFTTLAVTATPARGSSADHSDSPVFTIPSPESPPAVVGSSHLVRTDSGVSLTLQTSGLVPDHAVTLWLIAANNPEECEAGIPGLSQCGPQDHAEGRGDISVHNVAGRIVGGKGTAQYGAHQRVGDTSNVLFHGEPGLLDPRGAEILLVLKTHGPKIPGLTNEMLSTFAAGCATPVFPPSLDPVDEMVGTTLPEDQANDCAEIQISVHGS